MANRLSVEKQCQIVHALAECNSIRSIERQTNVHRDTIMRLGHRVGVACQKMLHEQMRELPCKSVEIDEIWGFVGKKQKLVTPEEDAAGLGDCWVFVAIDPETKVVPSFVVGKRDFENTTKFMEDLASRMKNRIQLSSDSANLYLSTVQEAFGDQIDYARIMKIYANGDKAHKRRRSSPAPIVGVTRTPMIGSPDPKRITTSHVEAQNNTMRTHIKRLGRLTNGHSRKPEHLRAAIALHYAYYNFVRHHGSIRMTPAMCLGVTSSYWTIKDLVNLT